MPNGDPNFKKFDKLNKAQLDYIGSSNKVLSTGNKLGEVD